MLYVCAILLSGATIPRVYQAFHGAVTKFQKSYQIRLSECRREISDEVHDWQCFSIHFSRGRTKKIGRRLDRNTRPCHRIYTICRFLAAASESAPKRIEPH